jgi:hypothetical protein
MELVLEFDRTLPILKAREMARRALDSVQMSCQLESPEPLANVSLKCSDLRRSITIPFEPKEG